MTERYTRAGQMIWKNVWRRTIPGKVRNIRRHGRPVELAYYEEFETKEQAMKREYAIKQLGRKEKQELIAGKKVKLSDERKEKED